MQFSLSIVRLQKISIPTPWKVIGNSEGVGYQKLKFLRVSMELNWNFWRVGRAQTKKPSIGEVWIFSGTTPSEIRSKFLF